MVCLANTPHSWPNQAQLPSELDAGVVKRDARGSGFEYCARVFHVSSDVLVASALPATRSAHFASPDARRLTA